ncbi:MAG TPA: hypothetical protein EYF98_14075 [Planctomycetes bacterium]|nr:hypothetical protein [Planctomycetota bacterium]
MRLIQRKSRRSGRPARGKGAINAAARAATFQTLRTSLGATGQRPGYTLPTLLDGSWADPGVDLKSLRPAQMRIFTEGERAWREFIEQVWLAWKNDVVETAINEGADKSTAKAAVAECTLAELFKGGTRDTSLEAGIFGTRWAFRGKLETMHRVANHHGAFLYDWLISDNIPTEIEIALIAGEVTDSANDFNQNQRGASLDHSLAYLIRHVVYIDTYGREEDREMHVRALNNVGPGTRNRVNWLSFPLRGGRKSPEIKLYSLPDMLFTGLLWHAFEAQAPHIGSMQAKNQIGAPGTVVAEFDSGEILVHLNTKRSVMIEGSLRRLCLRYPDTAAEYMQNGEVLSLRGPDQRVIATISTRGTSETAPTHRETKGNNNALERTLEPHVKELLAAIWSSRTFNGVVNSPKLRALLDDTAAFGAGRAELPAKIQWVPGAEVAFPNTEVLAPSQAVSLGDLAGLKVEHFTVAVRLDVLREIERAFIGNSDGSLSYLKEGLRGQLPFDLLATASRKLQLNDGTYGRSGPLVVTTAETLATGRDFTISDLGENLTLDLKKNKAAQYSAFVTRIASLRAESARNTSEEAEFEVNMPRLLAKEAHKGDGQSWRGKWYEKVTVEPYSTWYWNSGSWGRGGSYGHNTYRPREGVNRVSFKANMAVTKRVNKSVFFTMKFGPAHLRLPCVRDGAHTFSLFSGGTIQVNGARRGYVTAARVEKLVAAWTIWAQKQMRKQIEVVYRFAKELKSSGIAAQQRSMQRDREYAVAAVDTAKEAAKKAARDEKAFNKEAERWLTYAEKSGQRAMMLPRSDFGYQLLRQQHLANTYGL